MTCRICLEPCVGQPLHCEGKGSMLAHTQCVEAWVRVSGRARCEICHTKYVGLHSELGQHENTLLRNIFTCLGYLLATILAAILIILIQSYKWDTVIPIYEFLE